MKTRAILLSAFLFLILKGMAQNAIPLSAELLEPSGSVSMYFIDGYQYFNFKNLNSQLGSFGYPSINKSHSILGFGGKGTIGKLVIGAEAGNFINSSQNDSVLCKSDGNIGMIYLGYKVIEIPHFELYPIAGIGFGGAYITLQEYEANTPLRTFSNFLGSPFNAGRMGIFKIFYDLSLAADLKLREKNTVFIGGRAGYNFSGTSEWKSDNFFFVNAPSDKFENYYFQLIFGISIGK